jgi:hypothetical protein
MGQRGTCAAEHEGRGAGALVPSCSYSCSAESPWSTSSSYVCGTNGAQSRTAPSVTRPGWHTQGGRRPRPISPVSPAAVPGWPAPRAAGAPPPWTHCRLRRRGGRQRGGLKPLRGCVRDGAAEACPTRAAGGRVAGGWLHEAGCCPGLAVAVRHSPGLGSAAHQPPSSTPATAVLTASSGGSAVGTRSWWGWGGVGSGEVGVGCPTRSHRLTAHCTSPPWPILMPSLPSLK